MTEFIITSSVLIIVVILLQHFLKGKISLRLQYALKVEVYNKAFESPSKLDIFL